jgi:hypothetical protein
VVDIARLAYEIDSSQAKTARTDLERLTDSAKKAEGGAEGLERETKKAGGAMSVLSKGAVGAAAALGGLAAAGAFLTSATREAQTFETSMFRIEAVIRATGGVAGRSADQLRQQARDIALTTLESTEGILEAQRVLLTFRNVQGDTFDRTIKAAADMTAALGGSLTGATMQLAKALENPVQGLSALSRSGTVFTEQQRDMVRAMVEAGDMAAAQAFILSELEAQYGGTATAAAQGLAGAQDTLSQRMQEFRLGVADSLGLVSAATAANNALASVVKFLADNVDESRGFIIAAGVAITAVYLPAIAGAIFQTGVWIASLFTLRGALVATGIGAFIVLAGMLVNEMIKLAERVGGVSNAFNFMLAQGKAAALGIKAWFLGTIADITQSFQDMTWSIADGFNSVFGTSLRGMSGDAVQSLEAMTSAALVAAGSARGEVDALRDSFAAVAEEATAPEGTIAAVNAVADAMNKAGDAGKSAMKASQDAAKDLEQNINGPLQSAINGLSNAWGDFVANGFRDFKGFAQSVLGVFRQMISQMVAQAASARIMQALGLATAATAAGAGTAAAGTAAGAAAGTAAAGGLSFSGIATALGPVGLALGGAAIVGGLLFGRSRRRRQLRAQERAAQAEQQRAIASEADGLETRLLVAQGRDIEALNKARERELKSVNAANRALLEQVFAAEDARRINDERFDIENRLLELQGRASEVLARNREKELEATDAANRAILEQVFALEDQRDAAQRAADALQRFTGAGLFATSADRQFAATSGGFTRPSAQPLSPEERELLNEIVVAVREGNINQARLLTDIKRIEERRDLEPIQ